MLLRLLALLTVSIGVVRSAAAQVPYVEPAERAFLFAFTAQKEPKAPRQTHTWGLLVRCQGRQAAAIDVISWLPQTGVIVPTRMTVEPGRNFGHQETLDWCRATGIGRVTVWGPLEVDGRVVERFVRQRAFLESGAPGYQCVDFVGEALVRQNGFNCVSALDSIAGPTPTDLMQSYGDASGAMLTDLLVRRSWARPLGQEDDWVFAAAEIRAVEEGLALVRRAPPIMETRNFSGVALPLALPLAGPGFDMPRSGFVPLH
ncbi:MAG: hypothetical protein JNK76_21935 [Planctomycetales bacterium]|nr:hypothetical protein [Planctomycetales bacterium]